MGDSSENDSPRLKPKRKFNRAILESSESDSDSSVDRSQSRKRLRIVVSDEESSGSSVIASTSRRSNRQLHFDESSDWTGDESDRDSKADTKSAGIGNATTRNSPEHVMSDSSEGSSEKCPICLVSFKNQETGTPESCQHVFCVECITEWSKNVNTCPVDRLNFESIVVRRKINGKVIKHIPVSARRDSEDLLVVEDPTFCEICGSSEREECMLLCDVCDLGFHMFCLTPPLEEVPTEQWFCPDCLSVELADAVDIYASEVDELWEDLEEMGRPNGPRHSVLRLNSSNISRGRQRQNREPRSNSAPSTSRNSRAPTDAFGGPSSSSIRNANNSRIHVDNGTSSGVRRRRYKRRKTRRMRTVVLEYDIESGSKFPRVKKTVKVKRKTKRRKARTSRQPRTAARRSHVRASVRARLASHLSSNTETLTVTVGMQNNVTELSLQRHRAGIQTVNIFGRRDELDYFSDDDDVSTGLGGTLVSVLPRQTATAALQAHRQARRKMISIPSPPRNNSSADIISSIIESQELFHSKSSKLSVTSDGQLQVKVNRKIERANNADRKIDVNNSKGDGKTVPAYPGSGRGSAWNNNRGGASGSNYRDQQNSNSSFYRGGNSYGNNSFGGGNSYGNNYNENNTSFQGGPSYSSGNNSWQGSGNQIPGGYHLNSDRRRDPFNAPDRFPPRPGNNNNYNRGRNPNHRFPIQNRQSLGPSWQPYSNSDHQNMENFSSNRHSFGGYENSDPLDMTVGQNINSPPNHDGPIDIYGDIDAPSSSHNFSESQSDMPLQESDEQLEPPIIRFDKPVLSEDERSDSGLIIDTEKYDPTEPTVDDSTDDEGGHKAMNIKDQLFNIAPESNFHSSDTNNSLDNPSSIKVSAEVLDEAVQQVLKEHRDLIVGSKISSQEPHNIDSEDNDSITGDCPNFSIYSRTSVNIANDSFTPRKSDLMQEDLGENEEDLVQEEDDTNIFEEPLRSENQSTNKFPERDTNVSSSQPDYTVSNENKELEDQTSNVEPECEDVEPEKEEIEPETQDMTSKFNDMISRRCPITPNKRTPIKIKLNTLSAIKKAPLDLYDDNDGVNDPIITRRYERDISVTNKENLPSSDINSPIHDSVSVTSNPDCMANAASYSEESHIQNKSSSDDESIPERATSSNNVRERSASREDERSYTPCLDENKSFKSKDTSIESEKEIVGIEGLDTEMISEDEGNDLFSDLNNQKIDSDNGALELSVRDAEMPSAEFEEGEIIERSKILQKDPIIYDEGEELNGDDKKKKKREKKIDTKDKSKSKKKVADNVPFKRPSKNSKDRNYRDKDDSKKNKAKEKRRSKSLDNDKENKDKSKEKSKKQKRKDLERYDVRTIVSEKRHKIKDAFGRDISPRARSKSSSRPRSLSRNRSLSLRRSLSRNRRTPSRDRLPVHSAIRRSSSRSRRSLSNPNQSFSPRRRSVSLRSNLSRNRRSTSLKSIVARNRRSVSNRSIAARNRRSVSNRSIAARNRRSVSNRSIAARNRRSVSNRSIAARNRRSVSNRSIAARNRRSVSNRSIAARNRRSVSNRSITSRDRRSVSIRSIAARNKIMGRRRISPRRRRSPSHKGRRSMSPRGRRSLSPRIRQPVSPKRHRTISPKNKRRLSPKFRKSISPRGRRSISPRGRRSVSPRGRHSVSSRNRRSPSLRFRRSPSIRGRRSVSKGRRRFRKSVSRSRKASPKPAKTKKQRTRRSRLKLRSLSRNRSRSPKLKKSRKAKGIKSGKRKRSRSPNKGKKLRKLTKSRSLTPAFSPSPMPDLLPPPNWQEMDKSPIYHQVWASHVQSLSPLSPGWTPPADDISPPANLREILPSKERLSKKDKRRMKRNKEMESILRNTHVDMGPSKEVFTSGNNILVSVSFNKNQQMAEDPRVASPEILTKKRKRKSDTKGKKDKKEKSKRRRNRNVEIGNKKPVAIIDLENSPFKEITPSPKQVIVLSDSDNCEKEDELQRRQERIREELLEIGSPQPGEICSPVRENIFVNSTGPKTPPEPTVKFSISAKSSNQLRSVNPLHEEEEEEENIDDDATSKQTSKEGTHKGPNTPPDPPNSPPSSPDAYDPFEPTKSGSVTPEEPSTPVTQSKENNENESGNIEKAESLELPQKDESTNAKPISPIEKVLSLLQSSRAAISPLDNQADSALSETAQNAVSVAQTSDPSTKTASSQALFSAAIKPNSPKLIFSTGIPTIVTSAPIFPNSRVGTFATSPSQRNQTASQRIVLPSPTKSSPLKTQVGKMFLNKPSPIKSTPIKPMQSKTIISRLPLPTIKPLPNSKKSSKGRPAQNGTEIIDLDDDGMDSPYSPGSSDFGDLFEPPVETNNKHSGASAFSQNKASQKDIFDTLFGGKINKSHKTASAATKVPVKRLKKSKGKSQGKMDEENLKVLDDLPSSAVEMQVKTKFLKKLNRQERVVEEVKLVLKPHYNKKHVTKDGYKDILRRAVPKICHNKSGEINPAKIQALVEAYVKKFRKKTHHSK